MNNTLYVGMSRQMTLRREMDVIANNMANTDTAGFKVESMRLKEDPEQPAVGYGAAVPSPIVFVEENGLARNFGQGSLRQTGGTFDLGLQGQGFFQVQTAQGLRYTRDGRFTLNAQGQIVDKAGNALMSNGSAPLQVDPTKGTPAIAQDGTISQDGAVIGRVGVFRIPDRSQLTKVGDGFYDAGTQAPVIDAGTSVQQGMIEGSNVDAITQMTRMISVSRAYEQVSNMMDQTATTSDQSIQRLGRVN